MISWPFDSTLTVDGEGNPIYSRTYSADVIATILQTYFRNGVFMDVGTSFQVVESTGMKVTVSPGRALINGHHCYEASSREMTITAANAGMDRIDTIVLRLDLGMGALAIDLFVLTGTAAGSPVAPTLTRNAQVWEIALADLLITHGTSTIPQAKITDTRLDSTRCGVVASIIGDTDTSTYYAQIAADLLEFKTGREADFDAWFAEVQNVLGENAAGELLALINGVHDELAPLVDAAQDAVDAATKDVEISDVSNVFACDVLTFAERHFKFTIANTTAKTTTLANVPTACSVMLTIVASATASMTWPAGTIAWQKAAPILTSGKIYYVVLITYNGGTNWKGFWAAA